MHARDSIVSEGCYLAGCDIDDSVVGVRVARASRASRSVLLGADLRVRRPPPRACRRSASGKDVVLDRVIIDKNARIGDGARLVNEQHVEHADGDGYYIRERHHRGAQGRGDQAPGLLSNSQFPTPNSQN